MPDLKGPSGDLQPRVRNAVDRRSCNDQQRFLPNSAGLYSRTITATSVSGAEVFISDNIGIPVATIYAWKGIYIGDNTLIGGNTKILDNDFRPLDIDARKADDKGKIPRLRV